MDLHGFGCPEHGLTISGKCLSVCVCDKSFVTCVAQELIQRIAWNFIFSVTLI